MDLERTEDLIREFEKNTDCRILMVNEYKKELREQTNIPRTIVCILLQIEGVRGWWGGGREGGWEEGRGG